MAKLGTKLRGVKLGGLKFKVKGPVTPSLQKAILSTLIDCKNQSGRSPTVEKVIEMIVLRTIEMMPRASFGTDEIINGLKDLANKRKIVVGRKPKNSKASGGSDFLKRGVRVAEPDESSKK